MRPRVSIVLPVRNGGPALDAALDSLLAQTDPRWEAIVVDDQSTDDTAERLAAAARRDPHGRLRLHRTPPDAAGLVAALNLGLAHARAPIIARLDADDVAHPERLARQCEALESRPALGLVSCQVAFGGVPGSAGGYERHVQWLNSLTTPELIRRQRFVESPFAHPSVAFRRDLVDRHGGYRDGDFPEDYELWLRWLDADVLMDRLPETLLTWNDPPGRLSRTHPRYATEAFYRLKATYLARWLRRMVPEERPIWIWGAGRLTRRRVDPLLATGLRPGAWVDVDPRKIGRTHAGAPVVAPDALLTATPRPFVLPFVGGWESRSIITGRLHARGYHEHDDYLCCA